MIKQKSIKVPFIGDKECELNLFEDKGIKPIKNDVLLKKETKKRKSPSKEVYLVLASKMILVICTCLMLLLSCSGDKGPSLSSRSATELIAEGWKLFTKKNYKESEKYFSELTKRPEAYLVGHYGLGWTFVKTNHFENAKTEFNKFIVLDTLDVYSNTSIEYIDVQAGMAIAFNATREHASAISASQSVYSNTAWNFQHDPKIESVDIRLVRADSQFSLSRFADCRTTIRTIEPGFDADINTIEGQIQLARKLESLILSRR